MRRLRRGFGYAAAAVVGFGALPARAADVAQSADPAATAWILSATALVLFMTLPGLALFYGGLVRAKNVLSVMGQCVAIACLCSVLWLLGAYSLAFAEGSPLIGGLQKFGLLGVGRDALVGVLPEQVFFGFQMAFAVITPALIVGAFVERMRFGAVLAFSGAWLFLVYAPVCHWIWGGGWLAGLGVMDYAGGLVVHATAGISALVLAWRVGPRDGFPRDLSPPHSPVLTMMGAGMLWVGWYGFNGGSALSASAAAGSALIATHLSAAAGGLVWGLIERLRFGRVSMVGLVTGVVAGLATVTPASGFVSPLSGILLGSLGAFICFQAVELIRHRFRLDDSLDVFAVHGVGGILGTVLVAVLAARPLGGTGYAQGMDMARQAGVQLLGVGAVCLWSAVASLVAALVLERMIGLREPVDAVEEGLDSAIHGERAYNP